MKKIITAILLMFFCVMNTSAKQQPVNDIADVIKDFGADKESISVSIKNLKTGETVYSLNEKNLMNPASVQKILTMPAAYDTLGADYRFKTTLYSIEENSYLIKLSGDPYLSSADLKTLADAVKMGVKDIYIDDSILDTKTWGEGWQWDDDMNILMPRFGAYNIDKNLVKLNIIPQENGKYASIVNQSNYPFVFYNKIKTSNATNLDIKRDLAISANTLVMNGTIARPTTVYIPASNIKQYFEILLTQALENHKIYMKNSYKSGSILPQYKEESSVEHDLNFAIADILKNSNNMAAETVFKLAGGKFKNGVSGSDTTGIEMFNSYCKKLQIDSSSVRITDGSGVSKNNLVNTDFVTDYLISVKNSPVVDFMATSGEGTLTQRLIPVKNNLKAKTGTLSGISSIAGYLTSRTGNKYAFCIIQNGVKLSASEKKMLEDSIIKEMYFKL